MTGHCNNSNEGVQSPLKTMLQKIGKRYQSYCTTYKTHTMTTCHRGVGHTDEDRDLNSHVEDTGNVDNNESTKTSETTIAFG